VAKKHQINWTSFNTQQQCPVSSLKRRALIMATLDIMSIDFSKTFMSELSSLQHFEQQSVVFFKLTSKHINSSHKTKPQPPYHATSSASRPVLGMVCYGMVW